VSVALQLEGGAEAIASALERAIRDGLLAPGAESPSVRELASAAGVSTSTAAAALAELRRRGLIVTRAGKRSHISARPPLQRIGVDAAPSGTRDLSDGYPDEALLPDLGPILARLTLRRRGYGEDPVLPQLAELAHAEFAQADLRTDNLCLTSGALDGVERALAAQLRPGARVAIEDPGYAALIDLLRALGFVPTPVSIDERGPIPESLADALAAGVEAFVLTPRAQNPTGAALDPQRATELVGLVSRQPELMIVEDDHQGALAGPPSLSIAHQQTRWARVRSVAKELGPDLRLAFLAGDEITVSRVAGRLELGPGWVSEILQNLVVALLLDPNVHAGLAQASRRYDQRRQALLDALTTVGIEATGSSGFNVWIPVADETSVVAALIGRGWFVAAGAPFRLLSPPAIRVTTAKLPPADAEQFAADLAATLETKQRRTA